MLIAAILAAAYGLLLVYSATYSSLSDGSIMSRTFITMLATVIVGIIAAVVISVVDYQIISKLWPIIAAVCILLMVITYFFGVAPDARTDARCWLNLGFITIQTSEFLKVGFIISFSYHLDLVKDHINKIKTVIPLVIHGAIPLLLTVITGDMGMAVIFLLMFIGMLFLAHVNLGYFLAGGCLIVMGFVVAWQTGIINGLQRERITALFYPESYEDVMYQQNNGKIALGSGGLFGSGYLKGEMTQNGLVPENENDMILTVAGEELGFVGAIAVVIVLTLLIIMVFNVGIKARDNVGYLMCTGVATMLFAQMIVNIGMELSLLPCIGITLPLFSSGGSSCLSIFLALGIVLSVYRYSKDQQKTLFYIK